MDYESLLKQAKRWRGFDDDTVAEAIACFLQNPPTNAGAAPSYLYKICERIKFKANKRANGVYILPEDSEPIDFYDSVQIPELVEGLGELERTVVTMSFYENIKRKNIALELGLPDKEIKNALERSIYRLRKTVHSEYAI